MLKINKQITAATALKNLCRDLTHIKYKNQKKIHKNFKE